MTDHPDPTTAGGGATRARPVAAAALPRDRELLARWRDGDPDAGVELLGHYRALVFKTCRRLGFADQHEILDVQQELAVRLLDRLPDLADRVATSFAGYLVWQIRDLAKRRRRLARSHGALAATADPVVADPGRGIVTWDAIENCSNSLPPRERAVFALRYLQGLSLKDTASAVHSNENAVAQSVFRLSRRLRACLREAGFDEFGGGR